METKEDITKKTALTNFAELFKVKSLVTLTLTIVFSWLAISKAITGSEFLTVFTTVIAFYFGVQHEKKDKEQ